MPAFAANRSSSHLNSFPLDSNLESFDTSPAFISCLHSPSFTALVSSPSFFPFSTPYCLSEISAQNVPYLPLPLLSSPLLLRSPSPEITPALSPSSTSHTAPNSPDPIMYSFPSIPTINNDNTHTGLTSKNMYQESMPQTSQGLDNYSVFDTTAPMLIDMEKSVRPRFASTDGGIYTPAASPDVNSIRGHSRHHSFSTTPSHSPSSSFQPLPQQIGAFSSQQLFLQPSPINFGTTTITTPTAMTTATSNDMRSLYDFVLSDNTLPTSAPPTSLPMFDHNNSSSSSLTPPRPRSMIFNRSDLLSPPTLTAVSFPTPTHSSASPSPLLQASPIFQQQPSYVSESQLETLMTTTPVDSTPVGMQFSSNINHNSRARHSQQFIDTLSTQELQSSMQPIPMPGTSVSMGEFSSVSLYNSSSSSSTSNSKITTTTTTNGSLLTAPQADFVPPYSSPLFLAKNIRSTPQGLVYLQQMPARSSVASPSMSLSTDTPIAFKTNSKRRKRRLHNLPKKANNNFSSSSGGSTRPSLSVQTVLQRTGTTAGTTFSPRTALALSSLSLSLFKPSSLSKDENKTEGDGNGGWQSNNNSNDNNHHNASSSTTTTRSSSTRSPGRKTSTRSAKNNNNGNGSDSDEATGRRQRSSSATSPPPPPSPTQSFPCQYPGCTKVFSRAYNLTSHLKTHSAERPFRCAHCPLAFARRHDRERHGRLHSGQKPYVCHTCEAGFMRNDALHRHQRLCIPVPRPLP